MTARELYVVHLGQYSERITLHGKGLGQYATLIRFGRKVVEFKPSPSQVTKIRRGSGRIRITTDMTRRAQSFRSYRQ